MSEARRLLENLRRAHNGLRGGDGPCDCDACQAIDAFLASPEPAAREAVLKAALERTGKWARIEDGYLMCTVCCTGMRCECGPGEHVSREGCPNCLGKSGSIFADTSPAAAALLAQGERLKTALEKYGKHGVLCRYGLLPEGESRQDFSIQEDERLEAMSIKKCTCGFLAALAPGEQNE